MSWARVKAPGNRAHISLAVTECSPVTRRLKKNDWCGLAQCRSWLREDEKADFEGVVESRDIMPYDGGHQTAVCSSPGTSQISKGRPLPATDFLIQLVRRCSSALRVFGGPGHPDVQQL